METKKLKLIGIIILVLSLLLLVFQNMAAVEVQIFIWNPELPLALLILLTCLIGVALGLITTLRVGKKNAAQRAK